MTTESSARASRASYELTYWGSAVTTAYRVPLARRYRTFAAAEQAAYDGLERLADVRAAHPAIIYGPGLGRDGVTLA